MGFLDLFKGGEDDFLTQTDLEANDGQTKKTVPIGTPKYKRQNIATILSVIPKSYNDAPLIGEPFRDGNPVVVNASEVNSTDKAKLLDFSIGLIFAVRGHIEMIDKKTSSIWMITPQNVSVESNLDIQDTGELFNPGVE